MIVSRQLVNQNIEFFDYYNSSLDPKCYSFDTLNSYIDHYKNLFQSQGFKKGHSILIGLKPSVDQTASFFAATELGMIITISNPAQNISSHLRPGPKIEKLLPIDCFLIDSADASEKNRFFKKLSRVTIETEFIKNFNFEPNNTIYATPDSLILKCVSSGYDTNLITHTHKFFYDLIKRNSKFFHDSIAIISNLNHGSSLATFYLPALVSSTVTKILNFSVDIFPILKKHQLDIDHIMIPYPNLIEEYLEKINTPTTVLWTLSGLRPSWADGLINKKIKNIVSIFGCNETSGPVLTNHLTDLNFESYKAVDDFYKINLNDNSELEINIPLYNKTIVPGDLFVLTDNCYRYIGRPGMNRINGLPVNYLEYQKIVKAALDADLIIDQLTNRIYLAVYENCNDLDYRAKKIDSMIRKFSTNLHSIHKHAFVNKIEFLLEIGAVNTDKLIQYFRALG